MPAKTLTSNLKSEQCQQESDLAGYSGHVFNYCEWYLLWYKIEMAHSRSWTASCGLADTVNFSKTSVQVENQK